MKFVDEATVWVQAGHGGKGSSSFRREKYIPFGGPDGGDGGRGGHVYLEACPHLNTLVDFRYSRLIKAQNGEPGRPKCASGKQGEDKIVKVPIGTLIQDVETEEIIADLTNPKQPALVAKGGARGLGNVNFKSATNRAPRRFTPGKPGQKRQLKLTLHLLAHVGLVGLPNAGKSSLIRQISAAKPKVADYPFTTLIPALGTVRLGPEMSFVVADIPGIIEGASQGQGLGLQFLKHVSRTQLLLQIVDIGPMGTNPEQAIQIIENELATFSKEMLAKPRWLVLNKIDCLSQSDLLKTKSMIEKIIGNRFPIFTISAISGAGTQRLCQAIGQYLNEEKV